jgi:hypothetical protein
VPQANGVVQHFNRSLGARAPHQREIGQAAELADEVESFLALWNGSGRTRRSTSGRRRAHTAQINTYLGP